jgi:hypothetical protein
LSTLSDFYWSFLDGIGSGALKSSLDVLFSATFLTHSFFLFLSLSLQDEDEEAALPADISSFDLFSLALKRLGLTVLSSKSDGWSSTPHVFLSSKLIAFFFFVWVSDFFGVGARLKNGRPIQHLAMHRALCALILTRPELQAELTAKLGMNVFEFLEGLKSNQRW